jgi:hypothetical protein
MIEEWEEVTKLCAFGAAYAQQAKRAKNVHVDDSKQ